jgi:hypothetical protein
LYKNNPVNHRRFSPSQSHKGAQDQEEVYNCPSALDGAIDCVASGVSLLLMITTAYALYDMLAPLRARMSHPPEEEIVFSPGDPLAPQSQEQCCGQFLENYPLHHELWFGPGRVVPTAQKTRQQSQIKPQSSESTTSHRTSTQNVSFHDYSPGTTVAVHSEYDEVHRETIVNDLDLNNFFSRPILGRSFEWTVGSGPGYLFGFNPWTWFWRNPRVANRISNFKLLRAKLHIRVLINGSPLHYGRAMMYYTPLHNQDDVGRQSGFEALENLPNNSQKPHMWLNPTTSQGGDMELPFLWHNNALDLPTGEFDEMGELDLVACTPLKHANGGTTPVSITVLVWATDVVLSSPTCANVDGISPQSDEYSNKVFSVKASNIASALDKLSSAPVIGPYARATSLGASAMSALAALFGFSKPVELDRCLIVPKTVNDMAVTNGKDDSHKLTLDPKQELSIDPRSFGLSNVDEMDIGYIASKESYVTTFVWTPELSPAGSLLWNCIVDPSMYNVFAATPPDIPKLTMTASCFAALPFQYWRGSIKYRFQVVCSALHKGRIRVVYDPEIEVSNNDPNVTTPEYNLGYQTVVDISETKDFEVTVGWGQGSSYRHTALFDGVKPVHNTTALNYNSSTLKCGNGVLAVYVLNEVNSPSISMDDCYIVVSMAAGPDFEVAVPTGKPLNRLRYRTNADVNPDILQFGIGDPQGAGTPNDYCPPYPLFNPQSSEVDAPVAAIGSNQANTAVATEHADTFADLGSLTAPTNMVYFGETVRSFRALLKRFTFVEQIVLPHTAIAPQRNAFVIQRPAFPIEPGFTSKSNSSSPTKVTSTVQGKEYAYGVLSPLRFIASGFVGWRGSIRWKIMPNGVCCNEIRGPLYVGRCTACDLKNNVTVLEDKLTNQGKQDFLVNLGQTASFAEGGQWIAPHVEPITSIEVPFYSSRRFLPARSLTSFTEDAESMHQPTWNLGFENSIGTTGVVYLATSVAAGEDFTLGMFVGAPLVYLELIPPV